MMGRDGGRLGSTWNAIETPSWEGCWVSDIITVRKGLNAAALGGGGWDEQKSRNVTVAVVKTLK